MRTASGSGRRRPRQTWHRLRVCYLGGAEGERNQRGADTIGRHCTRRVKYRWTSIKALFRNCVGSVLSRNETQITRADTGAGDFDDRAVLVTYRSGSMGLVHLLDVQRSVGEFRDEVADLALGTDAPPPVEVRVSGTGDLTSSRYTMP